jgi:hypothetical protein
MKSFIGLTCLLAVANAIPVDIHGGTINFYFLISPYLFYAFDRKCLVNHRVKNNQVIFQNILLFLLQRQVFGFF